MTCFVEFPFQRLAMDDLPAPDSPVNHDAGVLGFLRDA